MEAVVFLADFYTDTIRGGAEVVNDILIDGLKSRGFDIIQLETHKIGVKDLRQHKDKIFIVGNFVLLDEEALKYLKTLKYVIFEHDHKYLKTRDPSKFPDYMAPPAQIVHRELYGNAMAVFCQSKIHARVARQNLGIDNIINLGCSLWSDQELATLRKYTTAKKNAACAIVESANKIKGTRQSIVFCDEKKLPYNFISSSRYEDFISQLAEHDALAFFPQVLESFCRLVVEARMLGCKLYTNGNNGCTSESWFGQYKGPELIDFVEAQREKNIDKVVDSVRGDRAKHTLKSPQKKSNITVILNSYRRPYNLKRQVAAIENQTVQPHQIWLWVNAHEDNKDWDYSDLGFDKIFDNDHNWKFFGRFAGALLADTEYVAVFDDDTIPGKKWFENCLDTMVEYEGILGSAGYIQTGPRAMQYQPERAGWPRKNKETMRVDYVGHAWFFKREWLSHLWREKPITWDNGEDIHFSYTAQKYGGIQTYCPPTLRNKTSCMALFMDTNSG